MDNNIIKEFFDNPYSEEYIKYCNALIRQNVTAISVSCKLLEDFIMHNINDGGTELVDDIIFRCRELMRGAVFGDLLSAKSSDMIYVSTDVFVGEFVAGCREVLGDKVAVSVAEKTGSFVKTDETVLRYLLLEFIRNVSVSGNLPLEMLVGSTYSENGNARIYISVKPDDADCGRTSEIPGGEDVLRLLSEKIGVTCMWEDDSFVVEFSEMKDYIDPVLRCRPYFPSDGTFSAYSIMLSGMINNDEQIF